MSRRVLLVRHGEPHPRWRGVCYGQTEVGLSRRGQTQSRRAAERLAAEPITALFSSDLRRARFLADLLAVACGLEVIEEPLLRERCFGGWEGRGWDEIHAETGSAMDGLLLDPEGFRPPGGESTAELAQRVLSWCRRLPPHGLVVAVSHGGPIAALRGSRLGLPVPAWLDLVPGFGEIVEVS